MLATLMTTIIFIIIIIAKALLFPSPTLLHGQVPWPH